MSESVDTLAAKLLAAAIKEGRTDYINAIQNLVPVKQALEELIEDPSQFDETWRARLSRSNYTNDEVRLLCTNAFLEKPDFVEFLVDVAANKAEKSIQYALIGNIIKAGLYAEANTAVDAVEDIHDFKNWLSTRSAYFARLKKNAYFNTIAGEQKFSRIGAILFDRLDLEVPDEFDGQYSTKERQWSISKFDAVVDWVSELCPAPRVETDADGHLVVKQAALVKAFQEERQRVQTMGDWHQHVFPRFVPVIADEASAKAMLSRGEMILSPEYGHVGALAESKDYVRSPAHNFSSPTHPDIDLEVIASAMSLLSYEEITRLRSIGEKDRVFLIPHDTTLRIEDSGTTPESLRIAMRYHRPEFLCSRYTGNLREFSNSSIETRAYLRGAPVQSPHYGSLAVEWGVLERPAFMRAFSSPQELSLLRELFNPGAPDPQRARVTQKNDGRSLDDEVSEAVATYKELTETLGYVPAVKFIGYQVFIQRVAEEFTREKISISGNNEVFFVENKHRSAMNEGQRRLETRLGSVRWSPFRDMSYEDLISKGTRLKGEADRWTICGILDRLGVVEVAKLAKTPAQRKFVIDNFDVQGHYRELPTAFRMEIGGKMLEDDLGM